jgi:uncharacterized protein (TIGR03000 family)
MFGLRVFSFKVLFLSVVCLMLSSGAAMAAHGGVHFGGAHFGGIGRYGGIYRGGIGRYGGFYRGGLGYYRPGYYGYGYRRGLFGYGLYGLGYGYPYGYYGSGWNYGYPYSNFGYGYGYPYGYGNANVYTYTSPSVESYSSYYPSQSEARPNDNTAQLKIVVPVDAELWFNGVKTAQAGTERHFISPALAPGKNYTYAIEARWMENGKPVEQTRSVHVHANDREVVDFTKPQMPSAEM